MKKRNKNNKRLASLGRAYLKNHPEIIKRRNEAIRKAYKSRKLRKKISEAMKKKWQDKDFARLIDKKVTEWWHNHPNVRKERSEKVKQFFLTHQEAFKSSFMNGKGNLFKPKYKTPQGFKVRSKCERQIAVFLHQNNIKCEYESKVLNLEGHICVPDFYLPKYKTYIEYYGGFPGSWKKKVLKNKLYKAHHIPCIFITPAELKNLDYYLINDLRKFNP